MSNGLKYPSFDVRIQNKKGKSHIFDTVRKKWLVLTPEEWVRQHVLFYLISVIKLSPSKISIEKEIQLNDLKKRFDILVYDNALKPLLIVECKAPSIPLNQLTIDQVLRYNLVLKSELVMITNGIDDFIFNQEKQKINLEDYFRDKKAF
jgi:hypothetical protein